MAALEVAKMTVWLRKFVTELSVFSSVHDPMRNPFDYQGVIANAKETRSHSTAKHILRGIKLYGIMSRKVT